MIKGMAIMRAIKKFSLKGAMNVAVTSVAIMVDELGNWALSGSESS